MDANKIIDNLLDRIRTLVRENAVMLAQLQTYEEREKARMIAPDVPTPNNEGVNNNA